MEEFSSEQAWKALLEDVRDIREKVSATAEVTAELRGEMGQVRSIAGDVHDLNSRVRENENRINRLEVKSGIWGAVGGFLILLSSKFAGLIH